MPLEKKTKKKASKAKQRLGKIFPRKKKTVFGQGYLGRAARQIIGRQERRDKTMEELGL